MGSYRPVAAVVVVSAVVDVVVAAAVVVLFFFSCSVSCADGRRGLGTGSGGGT